MVVNFWPPPTLNHGFIPVHRKTKQNQPDRIAQQNIESSIGQSSMRGRDVSAGDSRHICFSLVFLYIQMKDNNNYKIDDKSENIIIPLINKLKTIKSRVTNMN